MCVCMYHTRVVNHIFLTKAIKCGFVCTTLLVNKAVIVMRMLTMYLRSVIMVAIIALHLSLLLMSPAFPGEEV